jgi:DNA invertase Pin-like site-specific DNA recombinase
MVEIWKDILNYESYYQISNLGRVRSLDRYVKHYLAGKQRIKGKIFKPQLNQRGYLRVCLSKDNIGKTIEIHRLVAETFIPNPNNHPEVNHKNGVKTDNYVENLEWCTHKDNMRHAHKNGLIDNARGEKHGCVKLTENRVRKMRKKYFSGEATMSSLAKEYKVSFGTVWRIIKRKNWKHLNKSREETSRNEKKAKFLNNSKVKMGEKNHSAKLLEENIVDIRNKIFTKKYTRKQLAKEYGVSATLIGYIVNRKIWKHIE